MASSEGGARGTHPSTSSADGQGKRRRAKPILLNKLEGCTSAVNAAVAIPHEDAVISVSEDM